ncbi:DUF2752 domain-containing protein [Fumia xinanensis]|uniref:DUF2752 domain-containing protein n=1 Tax=Fumia xinanensis TaxID=2763659 RepID=A0A926E186_9FIRM|nr:DUF2752 domain-containing protein [Fumia xinanensis]MBC8559107.1 DUF2752 domain-containing protein [Fumia xinanensis]
MIQRKRGSMKNRKKWFWGLIAAALVVLVFTWGCPIRNVTGFPCPGCGMTRAYLSAFRLDFQSAFYWHPLWFLAVPLIFAAIFRPQGIFKNKRADNILWISLAVLFLGVYILRMILFFPHTPPMDYNRDSIFYQIFTWITSL